MHEIEQYRFSSVLNLAAGTKAFSRALRRHELFRDLVGQMRDASSRAKVAERVEDLAAAQADERYENRFDAALATYLTALDDTAQPEVIAKAATAAAKARNTWWTVGISHDLLTRAIATGFARAPAPAQAIPEDFVRPPWQRVFRNWWADREEQIVANESAVQSRLTALMGVGSVKEQIPKESNLIVMPRPDEEGNPETDKLRPRRRHGSRKNAMPGHRRARKTAS